MPLVAVAAVALGAGTGTAVASDGRLTVSVAKKLAHKLEAKQKRERDLLFTQLGNPVRRSDTRIDFRYRDRSTSDVLCKARIVVVQTGNSRAADIRHVRCHGIPSEMLAFEKVTRDVFHAVKNAAPEVRKSLRRYDKSLEECRDVVVPQERKKDVRLLRAAGSMYSFYAPLRTRLDDFDTALHDVHGQDPHMVRGVDAWDRLLVLVDQLPTAAADWCGALKEWAANGYTDDTAPADFDELEVIRSESRVQSDVLDETALYMAEQGVRPRTAGAFSPKGMVVIVVPHPKL